MGACIKRGYVTWCGRNPDQNEFTFEHAPHAVKHYAPGPHRTLVACADCVKAALADGILEKEPSMANRGGQA